MIALEVGGASEAMIKAPENVRNQFAKRSLPRLFARTSPYEQPSTRVNGRFIHLWLAIFMLGGCHVTFAEEPDSLPPLPKLSFQQSPAAIRAQVRDAYDAVLAAPRNTANNGKLGMILQAYGQLEGAEIAYRRAHRLSRSQFNWIYYLGQVQAAQGKCTDAVTSLREAMNLKPDYLPAKLKLAECLRASSQWDESEKVYSGILKDHPESAEAYYGLGKAQAGQHDLQAAIDSYHVACKLHAQFGAAHYALALAYRTLGADQDAQEEFRAYEKYKDSGPPNPDPLLEQVLALNHSAAAQIRLGFDLEHAGRLQEAAEAHERALQADAGMVQAHVNLISIYGRLNQLEKAEQHYRQAVQIAPNEESAYYNYGVLMSDAGRVEDAEKAFRKSVEINPSHAEAHYNLGVLFEQRGLLTEAESEFQGAVQRQPGYRLAHFHLGRLLVNRKDFSSGIRHLQKTIGTDDDETPTYLYALGAAYARAGDRETAIRYLRQGSVAAQSHRQFGLLTSIEKDLKALEVPDLPRRD